MATANVKTLSIADVSAIIDVPAKTIRKVLRANIENQPGRGGRWVIRESDIEKVRAMINTHSAKTATVAEFGD